MSTLFQENERGLKPATTCSTTKLFEVCKKMRVLSPAVCLKCLRFQGAKLATVAIQDLYPEDFAHCYGCGRKNSEGHHLKSFVEGEEVVARFHSFAPSHRGARICIWRLLASLVDCHAMAAAAAAAELAAGRTIGEDQLARYVTAALKVEYLKPTPLGPRLHIRGKVTERTEKKAVVALSVSVDGNVTVRAEAVAVRIPQSMERPSKPI